METEQVKIYFISNMGPLRYISQLETFYYQSCAELIQNVLKHSNADICQVSLNSDGANLRLTVSDNGINDALTPAESTGLGLSHIYKRAEALGGNFSFTLKEDGAVSILTCPTHSDKLTEESKLV